MRDFANYSFHFLQKNALFQIDILNNRKALCCRSQKHENMPNKVRRRALNTARNNTNGVKRATEQNDFKEVFVSTAERGQNE